jgi:hypothetical protein
MAMVNQTLKQRFESEYAGTQVELGADGTAAALQALDNDQIDLAAIGRSLTAEEKENGLVEVPISREKIAIFTGADNPFNGNLTFEQFARIFRGEITDWSEVGGPPGQIRFIDRPETSDTRLALSNYRVFKDAEFSTGETATQLPVDDTAAIIQELGRDGISYGTASQVLAQPTVRIVPMHNTLPDDPRYPYSQPRAYVYQGSPSPAVLAFLGFVTSPVGQAALQEAAVAEAAAVATAVEPPTGEAATGAVEGVIEGAATGDSPPAAIAPAPPAEAPVAPSPVAAPAAAPSPVPAEPAPPASDPTPVITAPPDAAVGTDVRRGFPWGWLLLPLLLLPLLWGLLRRRQPEPLEEERVVTPSSRVESDRPMATVATPPAIAPLPEGSADPMPPAIAPLSSVEPPVESTAEAAVEPTVLPEPLITDLEHPTPPIAPVTPAPVADLQRPSPLIVSSMPPTTGVDSTAIDTSMDTSIDPTVIDATIDPTVVEPVATDSPQVAGEDASSESASRPVAAMVGLAALTGGVVFGRQANSQITLLARDGQQGYAEWNTPEKHKVDIRQLGGQRLALRLCDVTGIDPESQLPHRYQYSDCAEDEQSKVLQLPEFNRDYVVEIGYLTEDERWLMLARSNSIRILAPVSQITTQPVAESPIQSDIQPILRQPVEQMIQMPEEPVPATSTSAFQSGISPDLSELPVRPLVDAGVFVGEFATPEIVGDRLQSEVEAARFDVGQSDLPSEMLASVDEGLPELPDGYDDSRIVLMPRDPYWAYAYWDVSNERKQELRHQGGIRLALRFYDVTDVDVSFQNPHSLQQYECDELARDWYLPVPVSDRDYMVEIGYLTAQGDWLLLARSLPAHIPPVYPTSWFDDRFTTVRWQEDLRGRVVLGLIPPEPGMAGQSIYSRIFDQSESAELQRVAGSIFGSRQQVPAEVVSSFTVSGVSSFVTASGAGLQEVVAVPTASGIGLSGIGLAASGIGLAAEMTAVETTALPTVSGLGLSGVGLAASGIAMSGAGLEIAELTLSGVGVSGVGLITAEIPVSAVSGVGLSGVGLTLSGVGVSGVGLAAVPGVGVPAVSGVGMSGVGLTLSGIGVSGVGLAAVPGVGVPAVSGVGMSGVGLTLSGIGVSGVGLAAVPGVGVPAVSGVGMSGVGLTLSGIGVSGVGLATVPGVGVPAVSGVGMSGVGLTLSGIGVSGVGLAAVPGVGVPAVSGVGMSGVGLTLSGVGLSGIGMSVPGVGVPTVSGVGMSGVGLMMSGVGLSGIGISVPGVGVPTVSGVGMSGVGLMMSGVGLSGIGISVPGVGVPTVSGVGMSGVGLMMSGVGLSGIGMSVPGVGVPTVSGVGMSGVGLMMSGVGMSGIGMLVPGVGVPTLSGVGMSGVGMSGMGMGASMPPVRPRQFWLVADAKLIVHGATEPDAVVMIGDRAIKLGPDGTFRFQLSFQDGTIDYPIMAIAADGEQTRSIHMEFVRETPTRHTNTKEEAVEEWLTRHES